MISSRSRCSSNRASRPLRSTSTETTTLVMTGIKAMPVSIRITPAVRPAGLVGTTSP